MEKNETYAVTKYKIGEEFLVEEDRIGKIVKARVLVMPYGFCAVYSFDVGRSYLVEKQEYEVDKLERWS